MTRTPLPRYEYNGHVLTRPEAARRLQQVHSVVVPPSEPNDRPWIIFSSAEEFDSWIRASGHSAAVARINQHVSQAQQEARSPGAGERYKRKADAILGRLDELSQSTHLALNSAELFRLATDESTNSQPPIFDPALLFEDMYCLGRAVPLWKSCPDFGWLGFNDRASSAYVYGEGVLFENVGFRGRAFWMLRYPPFYKIPRFDWFDNLASSGAI